MAASEEGFASILLHRYLCTSFVAERGLGCGMCGGDGGAATIFERLLFQGTTTFEGPLSYGTTIFRDCDFAGPRFDRDCNFKEKRFLRGG